jgi:hypothetical protein
MFKAISITIMMVFWSASLTVIVTSPAKYPTSYFPWVEDECYWVGGVIEKKEAKWDDGNFYVFTINGTVNNATPYKAEVLGSQFLYATLPVGSFFESQVCNTITLREVFTNGSIQLLEYGLEP